MKALSRNIQNRILSFQERLIRAKHVEVIALKAGKFGPDFKPVVKVS